MSCVKFTTSPNSSASLFETKKQKPATSFSVTTNTQTQKKERNEDHMIIDNLNTVIQALNNVEVKGAQNMANIVGSINILTGIIEELSKEANKEEE